MVERTMLEQADACRAMMRTEGRESRNFLFEDGRTHLDSRLVARKSAYSSNRVNSEALQLSHGLSCPRSQSLNLII